MLMFLSLNRETFGDAKIFQYRVTIGENISFSAKFMTTSVCSGRDLGTCDYSIEHFP